MIYGIKKINEIIEAAEIGANITDANRPLFTNSKDLEKYLKINMGVNFSIVDVENIIQSKKTDYSILPYSQPKPTILENLGVNIWDSSMSGADGIKAPNLTNLEFEFVNEGEDSTFGIDEKATLTYKNNVVSGSFSVEKTDFLNKTPEQINQWLLIECKEAIHNAIFKKLVAKITALTAVSGYTGTDTAKTYAISDFNSLESANGGEYGQLMYLVSSPTARKLKATDSGFNTPILSNRMINDLQTFVRDEVNNNTVILGDFSKAGVMIHGLNILIDPYTQSEIGKSVIRVIAKCDVHLLQSDAFSYGQNFTA